ncbi:CxC2 domain-containing protein [Mycena indigotica]|uniref:CxC2 domain-containing protein n=1 Tax=Mycena indigotica TaxID=2126181 RepID=A0A8H6T3C9_9AGAR|nr:CxC2 domain-containing protein [Mycena indigotica]KAF7310144.1 CxC2 domain-containing protein [Mycena indigotica]
MRQRPITDFFMADGATAPVADAPEAPPVPVSGGLMRGEDFIEEPVQAIDDTPFDPEVLHRFRIRADQWTNLRRTGPCAEEKQRSLGNAPKECAWCFTSCMHGLYACKGCILIAHERRPDHGFVDVWNNRRWTQLVPISELGYVYQVGHISATMTDECPNPSPETTVSMLRRGRRRKDDLLGDIQDDNLPNATTTFLGDEQIHISADGARVFTDVVNRVKRKRPRLDAEELQEPDDRLSGWTPMGVGDEDVRALALTVSSYETEPDMEDVGSQNTSEKAKRRHYASSDDPMSVWLPHASTFLDELVRRDGLADFVHKPCCAHCSESSPESRMFRCRHCGDYLQCQSCTVRAHQTRPLHVVEEWNGRFWCRTNLYSVLPNFDGQIGLGLIFQVGHHGLPCPNPSVTKRMVVIDVRGVFTLRVRTCNCELGQRRNVLRQLLAHGWYPATTTDPETCATLEALELFRLLQVVGNINVNDFVGSIERLTDATRLEATPDRYKAFFRMHRQYTYLIRAKRAGRAHDPGGLAETATGELAVSCWACPQPGRNLPEGWKRVDRSQRFLYKLILAVDANFRLKNRIRANERQDPALAKGKGYFVQSEAYKRHLREYVAEKEVHSCAAFAALIQQDTKVTTGLRVSGVGGVVCARHGLVRKQGMCDLQKGERYANIDYVVMATLQGEKVINVTISYDIACHWQVLLPARGERIRQRGDLTTDLSKYKMQFALPLPHGVGKTDGEGIERTWSLLNPSAWATKEMGEGARHDTLEDKIDHLNFEKNIGQGRILMRKLIVALAERRTQEEEFEEMTESISEEKVKVWERMVIDWEKDHREPNPFLIIGGKEAGPSEREVMQQLKAAEVEDARAGRAPLVPEGKMTAAGFVKAGLQLEESQRRILAELKAKTLISADRSSAIQEQRFSLHKRFKTFHDLQLTYMPGVEDIRASDDEKRNPDEPPPKAEHLKIYLPSELSPDDRRRYCGRGVADAETKLRLGQCADALMSLRGCLYTKTHVIYWRNSNSVAQKGATRSATLLERIGERIARAALKYRKAYDALVALKGQGFSSEFRKLEDADINGRAGVENDISSVKKLRAAESARASRNEPTQTAIEARVSWIWGIAGGTDRTELHDSVRVDWTKARARRDRWREEVALIREEMKRVLRCLATIQKEWDERAGARDEEDVALSSGLRAYALRQCAMHKRVGEAFYESWNKSAANARELIDVPLLRDLLAGTAVEQVGCEADEQREVNDVGDAQGECGRARPSSDRAAAGHTLAHEAPRGLHNHNRHDHLDEHEKLMLNALRDPGRAGPTRLQP